MTLLRSTAAASATDLSVKHRNVELDGIDIFYREAGVAGEIMIGLMEGLRENLDWFPRYQAYLREHRPPTLIVWGPQDGYMPGARRGLIFGICRTQSFTCSTAAIGRWRRISTRSRPSRETSLSACTGRDNEYLAKNRGLWILKYYGGKL